MKYIHMEYHTFSWIIHNFDWAIFKFAHIFKRSPGRVVQGCFLDFAACNVAGARPWSGGIGRVCLGRCAWECTHFWTQLSKDTGWFFRENPDSRIFTPQKGKNLVDCPSNLRISLICSRYLVCLPTDCIMLVADVGKYGIMEHPNQQFGKWACPQENPSNVSNHHIIFPVKTLRVSVNKNAKKNTETQQVD